MVITKADRMRRRRKKKIIKLFLMLSLLLILVLLIIIGLKNIIRKSGYKTTRSGDELNISINGVSRTGSPMGVPSKIIVRRSKVPGMKALEMRNRYEGADLLNEYYAEKITDGVHYVVGTDGRSIQIIPLNETAPGHPDEIIIEYCAEEDSSVPDVTVNEVNRILVELKKKFSLTNSDIISE